MDNEITNAGQLQLRIKMLKEKEVLQRNALKETACSTFESLTPINLLKSGLKELTSGPEIKRSLLNTAAGIGAGILGKRILIGGSKNIFKRFLGMFVQGGLTDLVANKLHPFKSNGKAHVPKDQDD